MNRGIIGVTVGTSISPVSMEDRIKPVKSINSVTPDKNGNVKVNSVLYSKRELFFSGNYQGNIWNFPGYLDWLKTPDDFDFKVRFSINSNTGTTVEYELTKADCIMSVPVNGRMYWVFHANCEGTEHHILTVAHGYTVPGFETDASYTFYPNSDLNDFYLEFFKMSVTEQRVVTSVNGVEADEYGNVEVKGEKGEKGDKGDKGDQGIQGDKGEKGDPGSGYSKTLLWEWGGSLHFDIKTLSLPITDYDALEIVYLHDCFFKNIASSGEMPMPTGDFTSRCFLLNPSGNVTTTVDIASDGTFTFTLKDNEQGTPWKIYGIKRSSSGESGEVSYTNVLDSVGYQTDKEILLGDETDHIGTDLTGYIKVVGGDIIRLKNVTMPDSGGNSNKIYCYNGDKQLQTYFSMTSKKTANSPVFKDGNLVQFTILDSDIKEYIGDEGWIRIVAANIDTNSIITVNEEID